MNLKTKQALKYKGVPRKSKYAIKLYMSAVAKQRQNSNKRGFPTAEKQTDSYPDGEVARR